MIKRKYLNEYEVNPLKGREAVYVGKKYRFVSSPSQVKRAKTVSLISQILAVLLLIAAEWTASASSYVFYTVIPYVAALILCGFVLRNGIASTVFREWVTHKEYDTYLRPQKTLSILSGAFCLLAALSRLFLKNEGAFDVLRLVMIAAAGLMSVPTFVSCRYLDCTPEE